VRSTRSQVPFLYQRRADRAEGGDLGQLSLKVAVEVRVLDRDRRLRGERGDQSLILLGEMIGLDVGQRQHPDRLALPLQRHAEPRAGDRRHARLAAGERAEEIDREFGIGEDIVDRHRMTMLKRLPERPTLIDREPPTHRPFARAGSAIFHLHQFIAIEDGDHQHGGGDEAREAIEDQSEQRLEFEGRGDLAGDVEQRRQLVGPLGDARLQLFVARAQRLLGAIPLRHIAEDDRDLADRPVSIAQRKDDRADPARLGQLRTCQGIGVVAHGRDGDHLPGESTRQQRGVTRCHQSRIGRQMMPHRLPRGRAEQREECIVAASLPSFGSVEGHAIGSLLEQLAEIVVIFPHLGPLVELGDHAGERAILRARGLQRNDQAFERAILSSEVSTDGPPVAIASDQHTKCGGEELLREALGGELEDPRVWRIRRRRYSIVHESPLPPAPSPHATV